MAITYKILSALLSYPSRDLQGAVGDFEGMLRDDGLLGDAEIKALRPLISELKLKNVLDCQEVYVSLFDRTRTLSLQLFEHVHGESRDRGQAMVDLLSIYQKHGLETTNNKELPDYIPLFLEFLSILDKKEAQEQLAETVHILAALKERLVKRQTAYVGLFDSLIALADTKPNEKALSEILAEEDVDPDDGDALDKVWEEESVDFGVGGALDGNSDASKGCPKVDGMLENLLTQMPDQPKNKLH
jgi:nitrate reductase delta subunit